MKKSDLKTGMIVKLSGGFGAMVMGNAIVSEGHGSLGLNSYDNYLNCLSLKNKWEIVSIYEEPNDLSGRGFSSCININYLDEHPNEYVKIYNRGPQIEIDVKINGKPAKLSDISDETLRKLKELE